MKNIALILILITGIVFLDSCQDDPTDPVLDMSKAVTPAITEPADGSSFVLTEENANDTITFAWSAAQYYPEGLADPTYSFMMISADSTDNASEMVSTTATSFKVSKGELNATLLKMGFTPEVASNVIFKVISGLVTQEEGSIVPTTILESNPVNASVTPYETAAPPEYTKLWVPGGYQGWAPDLAFYIQSFADDGIFTGYIYFPEDSDSFEFKFTSMPSWDGTNYGAGDSEGTLSEDSGAGNLSVPGPGGYRFNVDINNLTWTYELQTWGMIGEFNGWAEQWNLEWDDVNHYLTITTDIPAADNNRFKFRANDDWDVAMGDLDPSDGKTLTSPGADIPITDGNRTINLILSGPAPQYEIIEN